MDVVQIFSGTINQEAFQLSVSELFVELVAAAIFATLLEIAYKRFSQAPTNRNSFSNNFLLLIVSTVLIVSVVKSSIELSIGLLGALSIVRFRSAIKSPEELSYLFLAVGIGISVGSGQVLLTAVGFTIISIVLWLRHYRRQSSNTDYHNLHVTIACEQLAPLDVENVVLTLKKHSHLVTMKRLDEMEGIREIVFFVSFYNIYSVTQCKQDLQQIDERATVSFLDVSGLVA